MEWLDIWLGQRNTETCYEGRSTKFRQGEPEKITEDLVELIKKRYK